LGWFVIRISRPRLRVLMLSNPLNRVIFRNKALDYFRFAIGPQNIHPPARAGIFPRHESWSLRRCSDILQTCAYGATVQGSYPATITHASPESAGCQVPADRRQLNGESQRSAGTSVALTAASVLRSAQKRSHFGLLLRPILVEHDPDHDHRDGRNRQRADHRQLFEDSDYGCPPANSLPMREAPPCHTHTETPFGPQQQCGLTVSTSARRQ
jgi:hypothetical protein